MFYYLLGSFAGKVFIFTICCLLCLRETCEEALKEKNFLDSSYANGYFDGDTKSNTEQLEALSRVFHKAAEDDIPTEVIISYNPFLCGLLLLLFFIGHIRLLSC